MEKPKLTKEQKEELIKSIGKLYKTKAMRTVLKQRGYEVDDDKWIAYIKSDKFDQMSVQERFAYLFE